MVSEALVQLPRREQANNYPQVPLLDLDVVWFQVAGTICNLRCNHCFISCSPDNHRLGMMSLEQVDNYLEEAAQLGVQSYYFTGGEPFMNKDLLPMLKRALSQGPTSVLTNGILLKPKLARALAELRDSSEYSFDLRISIDGYSAETNDPIRGKGSFDRILQGVKALAEVGFSPVLTVTEACEGVATGSGRAQFLEFLRSIGLSQPRLKILPLLRLGAETERSRGYEAWESLMGTELLPEDAELLQCSRSRMVCSEGVAVCPILVDQKEALMAQTLTDSLRPYPLQQAACYTCYTDGLTCTT